MKRSTFHEHWHRIAKLHVCLRTHISCHRQVARGQVGWYLRDHANHQFVRLSEPVWRVVALLDGKHTVEQAWHRCQQAYQENPDEAPTQGEVIQALGQLYQSGMLQADISPDAERLLGTFTKERNKKIASGLMQILFLRIPMWNPDRLLDGLVRPLGWLFSSVGVMLWLISMVICWGMMGPRLVDLGQAMYGGSGQTGALQALRDMHLLDVAWIYMTMVWLKVAHEAGHGISVKYFARKSNVDGAVPEFGIRLLVMMPAPYVDATSSWAFPSKWHRIFVAAAGMYVELFIASIAALIWAYAPEGEWISRMALNTVMVAGISTVLFNINPLIRFDGYFMLMDMLEIPNLSQRSKDYLRNIAKRVLGVHDLTPVHWLESERKWFVVYGIASSAYMVFLGMTIAWYLSGRWLSVGLLLGAMSLIGFVLMPSVKGVWYLLTNPELDRTRPRAYALVSTLSVLLLAVVFTLPIPDYVRTAGVVHMPRQQVVNQQSGWLEWLQEDQTEVTAGELVARLSDEYLEAEYQDAQAQLRRAKLEFQHARATQKKPAEVAVLARRMEQAQTNIDRIHHARGHLELYASHSGVWHRDDSQSTGKFIQSGERLGQILSKDYQVQLQMDQSISPRFLAAVKSHAPLPADVRVRGAAWLEVQGSIQDAQPIAHQLGIAPALTTDGGGMQQIPMPQANASALRYLVADVHLTEFDLRLGHGQPLEGRIYLGRTTFWQKTRRWMARLLQIRGLST